MLSSMLWDTIAQPHNINELKGVDFNVSAQVSRKISNKCFIHCPAEDKAEIVIF
jgi:hypothetical protein